MNEPLKVKDVIAMIRTVDVHDAAIEMAKRLKLNAEVRVVAVQKAGSA